MDVLVIHPSFKSMGGGENLALQVVRNFKSDNCEVTLLTISRKEVVEKCSKKFGIELSKINVLSYDIQVLRNLPPGFCNIFYKIFSRKNFKKTWKI